MAERRPNSERLYQLNGIVRTAVYEVRDAEHAPRQVEVDTGEQTGLEGTQQPPHGQETTVVMYQPLHGLYIVLSVSGQIDRGCTTATIMIPHKNINNDNHTDGRSLFRNTLDGTCRLRVEDTRHPRALVTKTHLEECVWEEEQGERNQVLLVANVQILLHPIELHRLVIRHAQSFPARNTHLRIPNTRAIQEAEEVQEREPRDEVEVELSHELPLVHARSIHTGIVYFDVLLSALLRIHRAGLLYVGRVRLLAGEARSCARHRLLWVRGSHVVVVSAGSFDGS